MCDWSPFDDLDPNSPGLVVGVASGGSLIASASFGADTPGGEPLGSHSLFYVGSVAKQFTAAAVGTLVLDGRLALHDSVRRWLPELPAAWEPVRLRHLVSHTGGLGDSNAVDADAGWGVTSLFSTSDRVAIIAATTPASAPGVVHRYSNHGYVLLAAVVERASDETLGEFARRVLFGPAGMAASRFLDTAGDPSVPGWTVRGERVDIEFTCCGDGGLVTSLDDLAQWDGWLPRSPLAPLMLADRPELADGCVAHDAWASRFADITDCGSRAMGVRSTDTWPVSCGSRRQRRRSSRCPTPTSSDLPTSGTACVSSPIPCWVTGSIRPVRPGPRPMVNASTPEGADVQLIDVFLRVRRAARF